MKFTNFETQLMEIMRTSGMDPADQIKGRAAQFLLKTHYLSIVFYSSLYFEWCRVLLDWEYLWERGVLRELLIFLLNEIASKIPVHF